MTSKLVHHYSSNNKKRGIRLKKVAGILIKWQKNWLNEPFIDKVTIALWAILSGMVLFFVISATNFFGLGHLVWNSRLFSHLFVDKDGNFIWLGITSILAIVTLTFNAWDRRRQFKADLISKSRIKWIESVRVTVTELLYCYNQYWSAQLKGDETTPESYQEEKNLILKQIDLLSLYLGPDQTEHKKIKLSAIEKLYFFKDMADVENKETLDECLKKVESEEDSNEKVIKFLMIRENNDGKNEVIVDWAKNISNLVVRSGYGWKNSASSEYDYENSATYKLGKVTQEISKFVSVMSVYLKVEWNRAKTGN